MSGALEVGLDFGRGAGGAGTPGRGGEGMGFPEGETLGDVQKIVGGGDEADFFEGGVHGEAEGGGAGD